MNLSLKLDKESQTSIYIQLYKKLKEAILEERLQPHSKLLPIRKLAQQLNINPATVVKAYDLLEREDYIYKKVGSGSYISSRGEKGTISGNEKELDMLEYGQVELNYDINFASATPSSNLFPVKDFKKAINLVLDRDGGEAFVYQKSQGFKPLRQSISVYLENQNINIDPDCIQIVSGAQQAIDLLGKTLADFGDTVLLEEPTYSGALSAFQAQDVEIREIPLKADGIDLIKLEELLLKGRVSFIYIISSFHNPTGVSWSDKKKKELLKLAEKYDFLIIEDDCLSDLYYEGKQPMSIKTFDRYDRVIYIKSYSKIFMPGLRLAFIVLPERLIPPILAAKYATDISTSGLTQRAFDLYLRKGLWDKHLEKIRKLFSRRFYLMQEHINALPAGIDLVHEPRGGLYFWLSLPEEMDSEELYLSAMKRGLAFLPGRVFFNGKKGKSFFRLSFAAVEEDELRIGMETLIRTVKELSNCNEEKNGYLPLL